MENPGPDGSVFPVVPETSLSALLSFLRLLVLREPFIPAPWTQTHPGVPWPSDDSVYNSTRCPVPKEAEWPTFLLPYFPINKPAKHSKLVRIF